MSDLDVLVNFVRDMNESNSSLDKLEVIKKYPQLKKMFLYVYDTVDFTFGVTSANVFKKKNETVSQFVSNHQDIYSLLDDLANRKLTGYDAINAVSDFVKKNPAHEGIIYRILDRDLKVRADVSMINKVFPNCVPTFDVALAKSYEDHKKKVDFNKDKWFGSHKLDGCRCIAKVDSNGKVRFFSRQGKEFFTLSKVGEEIENLNVIDVVFDGEICIVDDYGAENFQGIMKEIKKKDHAIEKPLYKVFDMIPSDDFMTKKGTVLMSTRQTNLSLVLKGNHKHIEYVEQIPIKNNNHFEELRELARKNNWEGLIIRKDTVYEGKRSDNMLKVKDFIDAEYVVTRTENGPIRIIENGKEIEQVMLSKVCVNHKGNEVGIGSGFSIDQRKEFFIHPENIVGKTICVKYFEETLNEDGKPSLRFPTLKCIYDGEREE